MLFYKTNPSIDRIRVVFFSNVCEHDREKKGEFTSGLLLLASGGS